MSINRLLKCSLHIEKGKFYHIDDESYFVAENEN